MRPSRMIPLLATVTLVAASCGWSPPNSGSTQPGGCKAEDTPTADTVSAAVQGMGDRWHETANGHTGDCRLHWVIVSTGDTAPDAATQVLFFDRNSPLGPPTPRPRPYTTVVPLGDRIATVQYQWLQGADKPCCPTGIAQVRFQIGDDGKLKALDPIPTPTP
ncbi:MAG: LppP/LprE family lipoprotein [Mycolicibacterium cosmeticum]|nr:LppP/LprE family lipoprotein [Mycolicibacterium cosmeticum]